MFPGRSSQVDTVKIILLSLDKKEQSAIAQCSQGSGIDTAAADMRLANRLRADNYTDRLLWEEAASLRPPTRHACVIAGTWQ